nr:MULTISPECIES: hypothetical protein [unclassified Rhodococcus (in: high G+C Gram-positive bacteria)]
MHELTRVPAFPSPRIGEPARFRLLHHATVVITDGESYRMREAHQKRGDRP